MNRGLFVVSMAVLAFAVIFLGIATAFSYCTVVAAHTPKCAGLILVDRYHIGTAEIFGFPLFGLVAIWMIVRIATDEKASDLLTKFDVPVANVATLEVTYGMILVGGILLVALSGLGFMCVVSVERYRAVAEYCMTSAASPPSMYQVPQR